MRPPRDLTLLWALRSPCNLGCDYCYFGTLEDHRDGPPTRPGQLTHLPHGDLHLTQILRFLSTVDRSSVRRVFLVGGEPLIWPPIGEVISTLTDAGIEVIVCTNGIPLNRPQIRRMLLDTGVHGVSVSLDSADPDLNDAHRPARNHTDGWHTVVSGIQALLADRAHRSSPAIGVYSVITRVTLAGLPTTARFVSDLGVDYLVPQPISLAPEHPLHDDLALHVDDLNALIEAFDTIADAERDLQLPARSYPDQVASTVLHDQQLVHGCFGGHRLAFIQPDGSVWDCPSSHKIAAMAQSRAHRSIATHSAAALFPRRANPGGCDCPFFSGDCVNMWPLMNDFDRFLTTKGSR